MGLLLPSTYAETTYAVRLLELGGGVGYLLKDRVDDAHPARDAVERVATGATVVDLEIVASRQSIGCCIPDMYGKELVSSV